MLKLHKVLVNCVVTDYFFSLNDVPTEAEEILRSGYIVSPSEIAALQSAFKRSDKLFPFMKTAIEKLTTINLRDIIDHKVDISEQARENLVQLLCKGCRSPKWNRIRSIITYSLFDVDSVGILERMILNVTNNEWQYSAAQSYSVDIAYIRDKVIYSK